MISLDELGDKYVKNLSYTAAGDIRQVERQMKEAVHITQLVKSAYVKGANDILDRVIKAIPMQYVHLITKIMED